MADKTLTVTINARNQANAGFAAAAQSVRNFVNSTQKMEGSLGNVVKIGGLFAAAGVARQIEAAATSAAEARAEWERGEIGFAEFAGKAARAIPVVGDLARAFDALGAAIFGRGADIEQAKRLSAFQDQVNSLSKSLHDAARMGAMDEYEKRLFQIGEQAAASREQIRKLEDAGTVAPNIATSMRADVDEIERQAAQKVAEDRFQAEVEANQKIREARREHLDRLRQQQEEARRELAEINQRAADDLRESQFNAAEEQMSLDAELRARQLEAAGRTLDAELVMIEEHYRRRRDMAESAEAITQLQQLQSLEEQEARRKAIERGDKVGGGRGDSGPLGAVSAIVVNERFRGLQTGSSGDPQREQVVAVNKGVKAAEKQIALLEDIRRAIGQGGLMGRIIQV